jgi:hypothetical protein
MRWLLYTLTFLVTLMVIDVAANNARYTKPLIVGAAYHGRQFTNAVRTMVEEVLSWTSPRR